MTFFNRGNDRNRGGSTNYGRRDSFDRGSDRPAMFDAVCAKCGADCQVPFRPNGRKEVFCSKCFETNGGGGSRFDRESGSSRGSSYEKRDSVGTYFSDKQMFSAVCDECGDNCKVPFEPRNGKPVLCSNCFAGKSTDRKFESRPSTSYQRPTSSSNIDLEAINAKLDRILKLLAPKEVAKDEAKIAAKEITGKILEEIEINSGKKVVTGKTRKAAPKKRVAKEISTKE